MGIPAIGQESYRLIGTLTAQGSALTTDKSAATVEALATTQCATLVAEDGSVALDIRVRGVMTDDDENVLTVYAMRGDADHYTRIVVLTWTAGTQVYSGTNVFADTVAKANEKWPDTIKLVSDGANGIARAFLNTHGYRRFAFILTTKAVGTTSVMLESARE